uniref:Uncharacterized protein n=1 Tax=Timema bartmani TaxID=61472 RepID=A0A7R9EZI8_9NEOP|nr:unnamed protein product [Timema bartmani]
MYGVFQHIFLTTCRYVKSLEVKRTAIRLDVCNLLARSHAPWYIWLDPTKVGANLQSYVSCERIHHRLHESIYTSEANNSRTNLFRGMQVGDVIRPVFDEALTITKTY